MTITDERRPAGRRLLKGDIHAFRGFSKNKLYSRFKVIDSGANPYTFDSSTHLDPQ
jgi:hypothetical protein